jgi:lactoylglutathione lyase
VIKIKLGYTLVYVDDVEKTMSFYEKALVLRLVFCMSHKLGLKKSASGIEIGLVTPDVEKAFERAVKAGAVAMIAPAKKPWGQVVCYVRDCNGLLVEICSPIG